MSFSRLKKRNALRLKSRFSFSFSIWFLASFFSLPFRLYGDSINSFEALIKIQQSGSIDVKETIVYDFGSEPAHGIFRQIPLVAKKRPPLEILFNGATDQSGNPYKFSVSSDARYLKAKIGDPRSYISGINTFKIEYAVKGAIVSFGDHDELYWNATGHEWKAPILKAKARVEIPDIFGNEEIKTKCFMRDEEEDCSIIQGQDSSSTARFVEFRALEKLRPGDDLTIVLGLPPGRLAHTSISASQDEIDLREIWSKAKADPKRTLKASGILAGLVAIFVVFCVLLVLINKFFTRVSFFISRQKEKLKTFFDIYRVKLKLRGLPIAVEYEPPGSLAPIDLGKMIDQGIEVRDFVAVIVDLAVRGYHKITYLPKKGWFGKDDYEFVKLKEGGDLTHPADKRVFCLLFDGRDQRTLSSLETTSRDEFYRTFNDLRGIMPQRLSEQGIYERNPKSLISSLWRLGIALFAIFILVKLFDVGLGTIVVAVLFAFLGGFRLILRLVLPNVEKWRLSEKGRAVLAKAFGFRMFLLLTEKERLGLINAPEANSALFEKYLPHAIALASEEKWAKAFQNLNIAVAWFDDQEHRSFNAVAINNQMLSFQRSFYRSYTRSIPARSRYSSGFSSGGGHSGGGSGGGGGGRW